jgi:hypothetical protein
MMTDGANCAPFEQGGVQIQGPMISPPIPQSMPGSATPYSAPVPPPVQPDFTKANGGEQTVTPAGYTVDVRTAPASVANGAGTAAQRLPIVK